MLLDLKLRDLDARSLLEQLGEGPPVPFIVVTGQGDEKVAVEIMKRGALDYVMKDTALLELLPAVVARTLAAVAQRQALVEAQTEQRRLENELLAAGERERQSIGADLHDGVGQLLTALELMCTALKADTARTQPAVSQQLDRMGTLLREAVAQTRYLARGLVPLGDEPDALQVGLTELAARTRALGRVDCEFDCPEPVLLHNPVVTGHLYRIAQEAVNNALKHAQARRLTLALRRSEGRVVLEIADDGVGLPTQPAGAGGGVGLGLMRHRAKMIGAELDVQSARGRGVAIVCRCPIPA
jgi:signal transduction histidine kinase